MNDIYYGVVCPHHGPVRLSKSEYMSQMMQPDAFWECPLCGQRASWDDERYEASYPHEPENDDD